MASGEICESRTEGAGSGSGEKKKNLASNFALDNVQGFLALLRLYTKFMGGWINEERVEYFHILSLSSIFSSKVALGFKMSVFHTRPAVSPKLDFLSCYSSRKYV